MTLDSLEVQISSAQQRLAALRRRSQTAATSPRLLQQSLDELEGALEELRTAHERMVEQNTELLEAHASIEVERRKYWDLFNSAPDPYIVTADDSRILEANRAAAEFLNISQRFLAGKPLSVFVCEDRTRVLSETREIVEKGGAADLVVRIRPRERAPIQVLASVSSGDSDARVLRWVLRRVEVPVQGVPES